jgi:heme-degrading monooxygenase HmoA
MSELAARQLGYLGVESAGEDFGIIVAYWTSPKAFAAWIADGAHLAVQRLGGDVR